MGDDAPHVTIEPPRRRLQPPRAGGRESEGAFHRALPIYYGLLLAMLTGIGILLLWWLRDVLLLLFVAVLFASTVAGPAAFLERVGIPRLVSALLVYLAAFAILVAIGWFVVPPTFQELTELVNEAPEYVEQYEELRATYDELSEDYPRLQSFDAQLNRLQSRMLGGIGEWFIDLPGRIIGLIIQVVAVFVISILLVTNRERILAFVLTLVHPDHEAATRNVLSKMWWRVGAYLRAKLIVMAIVGVMMYVALMLIGVPFAIMLAIIVALGQLIPKIGPWLARIPLLSIALLDGWVTLALTYGASVIVENLKGLIIAPYVEGDQLNISPLVVFIAVLAGAALFGAIGAFVAVPFAAMLQVLFEEVIVPWRQRQFAADMARRGEVSPGPPDAV